MDNFLRHCAGIAQASCRHRAGIVQLLVLEVVMLLGMAEAVFGVVHNMPVRITFIHGSVVVSFCLWSACAM